MVALHKQLLVWRALLAERLFNLAEKGQTKPNFCKSVPDKWSQCLSATPEQGSPGREIQPDTSCYYCGSALVTAWWGPEPGRATLARPCSKEQSPCRASRQDLASARGVLQVEAMPLGRRPTGARAPQGVCFTAHTPRSPRGLSGALWHSESGGFGLGGVMVPA